LKEGVSGTQTTTMVLFVLVVLVVCFLSIAKFLCRYSFPVPPKGAAVLVSGAGTGIGRCTSFKMAQLGYQVYSGVQNKEEGDKLLEDFEKFQELNRSEKKGKEFGTITPLVFDITNEQDIERVYSRLDSELSVTGLPMLVNNAGIGLFCPLEIQPFSDFHKVINVNLLGHCRVTQKMLPLLRRANSARIVNITSIAGKVSPPYSCAYSASKYALEAVSDALRRELRPLNISVSTIEPGFARTSFVTNGISQLETVLQGESEQVRNTYQNTNQFYEKYAKMCYKVSLTPDDVVKPIKDALLSAHPKPRYLVGHQARLLAFLIWLLPDEVADSLFSVFTRYL